MAKINSQVSTLEDEPVSAAVAEDATKPLVLGSDLSGKMEILTIHSSNEDGGGDAVFVGLNGYPYQIPRDTPCKVPTEVAQILRDAVTTTYKPGPNGIVTPRSNPRFAFSSQSA